MARAKADADADDGAEEGGEESGAAPVEAEPTAEPAEAGKAADAPAEAATPAANGKAAPSRALATVGSHAEELREAIWPAARPAPTRTVRCRHCKRKNRVRVPDATMHPERHRCGSCDEPLFIDHDAPLTGISALAYQHSLDRRSTAALASVPGALTLVRWSLEQLGDRTVMMRYMSDAILCGKDQFPELLAMVDVARSRLDIEARPTVFLGESPHMNAMTTGVAEPVIVVGAALLDQMENEQVIAVLGHELGHLHSDHPLYLTLAQTMLQSAVEASPLVALVGLPIHRLLLRWARCAELTADRAALLACRDLSACVSVMLRFAGGHRPGTSTRTQLRLAPFIEQCRQLARMQASSSVDQVLGGLLAMDRSHPHLAWRVMHLMRWVEHGNYLDILAGDYLRRRRPMPPPPRLNEGDTSTDGDAESTGGEEA